MKLLSTAALALLTAAPAFATSTFTLDFEGATGYVQGIGNFYNGGTTQFSGQTGTNYGVSFNDAAVVFQNDEFGPYYSNSPTNGTAMYADGNAVMNVAAGMVGGLSFFYSSSQSTLDSVNIYSGLNGTGTLLASASLFGNAQIGCTDSPFCRFDLTSVKFAGVAQSVSFGGNSPNVLFDNITITAVPEPSTYLLLVAGLLAVSVAAIRRDREG